MKEIKVCSFCVMDNASDPNISFDENGQCNYCRQALSEINTKTYFPNEEGQRRLRKLIAEIKEAGKNNEYDCIMGISGGLDSSYLAYLASTWGLRILAIHIDDDFDTEISKSNIKKLIDKTGYTMITLKPDFEQYADLTKAYMKAGVPNLAIPQDNILFAEIYKEAKKRKIRYFLSGGNFALESVLQTGNTYTCYDLKNIKDIHKRFGTKPMDKLSFLTSIKKAWYNKTKVIASVRPLNFVDYNRDRAFKELKDFCGFEYYGSKHLENALTAFIQLYWLPKKFNVDKRKSHLSSMIVSGQMTRDQALKILKEPMIDSKLMDSYIKEVKEKIGISDEEFDAIMAAPTHQHTEYKTEKLAKTLSKIKHRKDIKK